MWSTLRDDDAGGVKAHRFSLCCETAVTFCFGACVSYRFLVSLTHEAKLKSNRRAPLKSFVTRGCVPRMIKLSSLSSTTCYFSLGPGSACAALHLYQAIPTETLSGTYIPSKDLSGLLASVLDTRRGAASVPPLNLGPGCKPPGAPEQHASLGAPRYPQRLLQQASVRPLSRKRLTGSQRSQGATLRQGS